MAADVCVLTVVDFSMHFLIQYSQKVRRSTVDATTTHKLYQPMFPGLSCSSMPHHLSGRAEVQTQTPCPRKLIRVISAASFLA